MKEPVNIDLDHREYRADPIKGEPFFGIGWPFGMSALLAIAGGTIGVHVFGLPVWAGSAIGGIFGMIIGQVHSALQEPPQEPRLRRHTSEDYEGEPPERASGPHRR